MSREISLDLVSIYRDHPKWNEVDHWTGMGIPLLQELQAGVVSVTAVLEEGETAADLLVHYTAEGLAQAKADFPDHVYVCLTIENP